MVARLVRDQEARGSNPRTPTMKADPSFDGSAFIFVWGFWGVGLVGLVGLSGTFAFNIRQGEPKERSKAPGHFAVMFEYRQK